MVRQSPSRPSILQAKRPPQSIANPGDHDGKDEDRRYAILAGCPELAASAFWGRSGIGGWVLTRPPDCPNDPTHRTLATDVVGTLACRYSDSSVVIDTATVNPARLIDLPGTRKAKGSPRPERPWRLATLDGIGPHPVASRCGDPGLRQR